jgi:hypothetical protein
MITVSPDTATEQPNSGVGPLLLLAFRYAYWLQPVPLRTNT